MGLEERYNAYKKTRPIHKELGEGYGIIFPPGHSGISGIPAFSAFGLVLGDFPPSLFHPTT